MNIQSGMMNGTALASDSYEIASAELLRDCDIALLPGLFIRFGPDHDFSSDEAGQALLADMLYVILQAIERNDVPALLMAMQGCSPGVARQARDLLAAAFMPDAGQVDASAFDDVAAIGFALMLGLAGERQAMQDFLRDAGAGRTSLHFFQSAALIGQHFTAQDDGGFTPKLVIWDLDDTLWRGTLAEGDAVVLDERRAGFVRALNRQGIVSAICSKNDHATARATLEAMGLWDEFVFPRIAFVPKGAAVRQLIADMQLRPENTLFIDDNAHNLHEVADAVPGIRVIDATSPECNLELQSIVDSHAHIHKSRIADYRILESRIEARTTTGLTDEAFLLQSDIQVAVTFRMDNLDFADRIEELINRSNQLNYTETRVSPGEVRRYILDVDHYYVFALFAWDKYGYYGLVGTVIYQLRTDTIEHLAFSCRIMHMGMEAFLIERLRFPETNAYANVDVSQLRKRLPAQRASAIRELSFYDPAVRAKILAAEAPRDWSAIRMRIMADCQSGAFHHYSRHRAVVDFDNRPRLFSLPMMLNDAEMEEQQFPPFLVYTVGTDYTVWRWDDHAPDGFSFDVARDCIDRFVSLVLSGNRQCLLLLPPEDMAIDNYMLHVGCDPEQSMDIHRTLNAAWRDVAQRHPGHFTLIEIADILTPAMYVHAHHYTPSGLKLIAGRIDDWYENMDGAVHS